MKMQGEIVNITDLDNSQVSTMFSLMTSYYDNVDHDMFLSDLTNKNKVILLKTNDNTISGFSTVKLFQKTIDNQTIDIVYSGDTIIDRQFWGSSALALNFCQMVVEIDQQSAHDLYWYLISKGYRTYRFLPVFFQEFYPRINATIPQFYQQLLQQLGGEMFGDDYDSQRYIVKAKPNSQKLKAGVGEIDSARLKNKDIAFFNQANPHHYQGDELTCITRVALDNFTKLTSRLLS